jgi:hypothetical protein
VADLLECLIQLKALEHSVVRLERFVAASPAAARLRVDAVLDRLLDDERAYAMAVRADEPAPPADASADRLERFSAARRATLAALQRCSAEELGCMVDWPGRPGTSAADLVAIMLAHDTERIGEIQRLLTGA